jgi:hypothetical protein
MTMRPRRIRRLMAARYVGPPASVAPTFSSAPTILGVPTETIAITYQPAPYAGTEPITVTRQWQSSANGTTGWADIPGATGVTLVRAGGTAGTFVRVVETAVGVIGPNATTTSAAVIVAVFNSPPAEFNAGIPVLNGTPTAGAVIGCSVPSHVGAEPVTLTYEWKVDGVTVGTGASYTPTGGDVGKALTVTARVENPYGFDTATSTPANVAAAPPPNAEDAEWTLVGYGADPATRVTAEGYVVLQKHASAKYVYVDPVNGNDTWDGTAGVYAGTGTVGPKRWLYRAFNAATGGARNGYGDWICIAVGTDPGHLLNTTVTSCAQVPIPQGLSEQYPTVITTYDPSLMSPGSTAAAGLRAGYWRWDQPAAELSFNSLTGAVGYKEYRYVVLERMRSISPTKATTSFQFGGPGSYILVEDVIIKRRQYKHTVNLVADSTKDHKLTHICTRRSGLWKGLDQNYKSDEGVEDVVFDRCVVHGGGYSGDLRTDAGQSTPPGTLTHNMYCYGRNTKLRRCVVSHGSSFGVQLRQGGVVVKNLLIRNPNGIVFAGASTDTNQDWPGIRCVLTDNVLSGTDYVNGVSGGGGWGLAFNSMDETADFSVARNLLLNGDKTVANGGLLALQINAGASNAAVLAKRKTVTLSNTIGISTSMYKAGTTHLYETYYMRGSTIETYRAAGWTLAVNDQLSLTSGGAGFTTATAIAELPTLTFNGALPNFDSNIIRGWGTAAMSTTVTSPATMGTVSRTNNVWNEAADGNGNVTYASMAGGYPDPTRDAETWAVSLGYADSMDLCNFAVQHPEMNWAADGINYIRSGFGLASV